MLDLEARFSPRIIPASTEYPYGKLKPNTAPAENDGTPVAADTGNDIEGFKQSVVTRANIDPSGIPDNAINSQLLEGLDKRYLEIDYQAWTFATGGLLIDCSQAAKHTNNKWYSWSGVFPEGGKVVAAGTDPTVDVGYVSRVTPFEHLPVIGASSTDNTGTTYVQDLIFDTYGHVTGLVSTEVREGNTSQTGIVQLTDSTSSTSTTTAATPNSVKNTYDLANAAIPSVQKGSVGGVATLDGSGKVPTAQLPSAYEIGAVPLTRTVNSKPLSEDVTITASDVGALGVNANAVSASKWLTPRTMTFSGDSTGSGSMNGSANVPIALTLTNSGVTAGIYKSVTVDSKGRVTAGTNPTTLAGYGVTDAYSKTEMPYETGTFTPSVYGLTTTGTFTAITRVGKYTRIGDTVFVFIRITGSLSGAAGGLSVGPLPFVVANDFLIPPASIVATGIIPGSGKALVATMQNSGSRIELFSVDQATGTGANILAAAAAGSFTVQIACSYKV